MRIKRITFLLTLLAALGSNMVAAPLSTNRVLVIDPSSMPVAAGKASLTIGALQRTGGVYTGEYQIVVSPYFFKNEKGRLSIVVSDESLARVSQGNLAVITGITGTATTDGKGGEVRPIGATATPANMDRGRLKLWFTAGDRKMIFEPAYHFAEKGTAAVLAPTPENNDSNLKRRPPGSHREAVEAAARRP